MSEVVSSWARRAELEPPKVLARGMPIERFASDVSGSVGKPQPIEASGLPIIGNSPAEFAAQVRAEVQSRGRLLKQAGVQVE